MGAAIQGNSKRIKEISIMSELNREQLGEYVRLVEIDLAYEQSNEPAPQDIVPYRDLSEADKERHRRIGEFIANILDTQYHPLDLYQKEVQRTVGTKGYGDTLAMTAMGLAGETGEVCDIVKKVLWHSHELDRDKMVSEIGDVLWYLAALCNALNVPLKEVLGKNVEKLRKRYPEGFDAERSRNREDH